MQGEVREEALKAAIGPRNQDRYLAIFSRFEQDGKASASWHWPAFFFSFAWFLYRRMWLYGLLYLVALPVLGVFVMTLLGVVLGQAGVWVGVLLHLVVAYVLLPMYADALYYRHCKSKIQEAGGETESSLNRIWALGGTSGAGLAIALLLHLVPTVGVVAAVALPAYHDYTLRAHVGEAYFYGRSAAQRVELYQAQQRSAPPSLAAAGFTLRPPPPVRSIELDTRSGAINVTLAVNAFDGQVLSLVPTQQANGRVEWVCMSSTIDPRYLPRLCRR